MTGHRDPNVDPCPRCGIRGAALQVAGAFDCLDDETAADLADLAPNLFAACQAMAQEVQGDDEHDTEPEA